ncbi:MAG TPA: HEPN domain-containing protein [Xanthobacteraceae bacterium]|nr:HEPN domain-containing protein [Xanthobacteraceae bacterium]
MTPETGYLLAKARRLLGEAEITLANKLNEAAGRAAYLAGVAAAQAFISERTGRTVRSHGGVQAELQRLTKDGPLLDLELRAFLGRTYRLKEIADYESGPGSEVSPERAAEAIATAKRFVAKMAELIG